MLARVVKSRFSSNCLNRVLNLRSLLYSTNSHIPPTCKSQQKFKSLPRQWAIRHYCSKRVDIFAHIDYEERKMQDSDDESDGTIYLDTEDVHKNRLEVPEVELCLPLIITDLKPLFPRFSKIVVINNRKLIELVRGKVLLEQPYVGVFLRKEADCTPEVVNNLDEIYDIGTIASIKSMQDFGDCLRLVVKAQQRVRLKGPTKLSHDSDIKENRLTPVKFTHAGNHFERIRFNHTKTMKFNEKMFDAGTNAEDILLVKVQHIKSDRTKLTREIKTLKKELVSAIKETCVVSLAHKKLIDTAINNTNLKRVTSYLSDFGASVSGAEPEELQQAMAEMDVPKRMRLALSLLKRQLSVHNLQKQIAQKVERNVVDDHRKAILEEKLKEVVKELGMGSADNSLVAERFEQRLKSKCVPKNVLLVIKEELLKLRCLDCRSEAFSSARNYLDWLTVLPWGIVSAENLNLEIAEKVLNEDHYGMEYVKQRILEFIAASQLRGDSKGGILCIHGPPGVGKTSIASSIARALNRKFFSFSVGGLSDAAEIKGHRRTYIGAMPGKVIQCLKNTKTENPLMLLDEVDKIGSQRVGGGEAVSAMLELLDPEQNKTFLDHFVDVPVDLSRVFFVCTANDPQLIPPPLRDRMELLPVAGFTDDEKHNIATKHLLPKILRESGIKEQQFMMTKDALETLISDYCRESGVRKLQQKIEKIVRKVALKLVKHKATKYVVTSDILEHFIGKLPYRSDRFYERTPAGVVMFLAYNFSGGIALYIESSKRPLQPEERKQHNDPKGTILLTGNLGNVMRESAQIALTVARNFLADRFQAYNSFETQELHLNVPSGGVYKDGACAGIAIAAALVSLAIDEAVPQNIALAGEISLTGKVLPTQNIQEKVMAAKRNDISCLILPNDNRRDYEELPEYITRGIEAHFVSCFEEVYKIVFETNKHLYENAND